MTPELAAKGDGAAFMTIRADSVPATSGYIYDERGGSPSVASQAWLDVPAGGKILSFHASADGPDFLVFLVKSTGSDVATSEAPLVIPEAALPDDPWVDEVTRTPHDMAEETMPKEPEGLELDLDEEVDETYSDTEPADPDLDIVDESEGLEPGKTFGELFENLEVGPRLGLGIPTWGSGSVPSIAARAYLPLVPDLGGIATTLGWYRLKYEDENIIVDPYLGSHSMDLSWRTHVVHLSIEAAAILPFELGPAQPVAGAGLALYWARRVTEDQSSGGLAPGMNLYGGARFGLPVGSLEATLGWNGGRRGFENIGQDSRPVRESLASSHLEISWMMELP